MLVLLLLLYTSFPSPPLVLAHRDGELLIDLINQDNDEARIIGGTRASRGEFPGHAVTDRSNNLLCGGGLVWGDMVLTAAHCKDVFKGGNVYIGGIQQNGNDEVDTIRATDEFVYPAFNRNSPSLNDVMLVKLASSSSVTPFKWNDETSVPFMGDNVVAIGFGGTDTSGSLSDNLQKVTLQVIPSSQCANHPTEEVLCGGAPSSVRQASTCGGDSGSPLLSDGILVGLNSFGIRDSSGNCQVRSPTGFSRVSNYADWIFETICEESDDPPSGCTDGTGNPTDPSDTTDLITRVVTALLTGAVAVVNFLLDLVGRDPI